MTTYLLLKKTNIQTVNLKNMNREIKFRAWDYRNKRMVWTDWGSFRNWYDDEKCGKVVCARGSDQEHDDFSSPMQFTGLKDKKGKDVVNFN
jgi:hypothetical protein